ncbi:MAG: hypothetical protein GY705_27880 [Bacteroidetes bacterium]|nr:hypothetical protein [Bacteroidota bacterium]
MIFFPIACKQCENPPCLSTCPKEAIYRDDESDRVLIDRQKCAGCGDCILGLTGGICPIARCAKRLFNGPCGGSSKGKCEISMSVGRDVDCAWAQILDRLQELDKMDINPAIK